MRTVSLFAFVAFALAAPAMAQDRIAADRSRIMFDPVPTDWAQDPDGFTPARIAALNRLGQHRYTEAANLLADLVSAGDDWAAGRLARLYLHGLGVDRDDAMALSLLEFAAERGDASAALAAGVARARGLGATADTPSARHWLTQAARTGNEYVRRDALRMLRALPTD